MKLNRWTAMILAVVLLCVGLVPAAGAETSYYQDQVRKYMRMKENRISVWIDNEGIFARKTQKFWAREVTGVAYDGSFNLGPWVCFDECSDNFTLPGTYAVFGYSVDIFWGQDWPYSGCFRNAVRAAESDPAEVIWIKLFGGSQQVGIEIRVNGETVYQKQPCDSHTEWIPK